MHCLRIFEFLHEICVIPESFLRSHLMMTRPDMVGRCWSLMRIALHSSFVHLEASLCQGEVRTNTSCCLVARVPFHPQSTIVARWRSIVILGDRRQYGCVTNTSGCLVARVPFHPQSTIVARWRSIVILDDRRQYGCVGDRHAERVQTRALLWRMTISGHSGSSSLRLGAKWSVGDVNWMPRHSLLTQSRIRHWSRKFKRFQTTVRNPRGET